MQYHRILQGGLRRLDESKSSFQIAGHEIVIQEQIANAAEFLQWAKDWIDDAIKASSEATLAWTVICIGLPFLTKPAAADKANMDGFKYISSRMRYYIALESLLSPKDPTTDPIPDDLKNALEGHVIELYQQILRFQIKSVLRFYKSSLKRFVEDIRGKDDWTEMRTVIEGLEGIVYRDAKQISGLCSGRRLEELTMEFRRLEDLAKDGAASLKAMQSMLAIAEQHLKVSEELRDISAEQRDIQKEHLDLARDISGKEKYNERNYHLLFRVRRGTQDSENEGDYEWYKNRIESRVEGTCKWFLDHPKYKTWTSESCGPLLVSADPGCGKSVLAKHLIDYELAGKATVCYFFFKDQDQNTIQQALRALLHQILIHKPILAKHVRSEYRKNGESFVTLNSSLWNIFEGAINDEHAGSVIFVLDALDECAELDLKELVRMLKRQFKEMKNSKTSRIKFLLTSRPYEQIMTNFRELVDIFPYVRIPGEEASEQISKEVNCVIEHRVWRLAKDHGFNPRVEETLRERLLRIQHRTYLWVYLVFNYIEEQGLEKRTEKGVEASLATLPKDVNEAYEKILNKVVSGHRKWVNKALCIIVAAAKAFTLEEMNIAVNIEVSTESVLDLDLEEEQTFASRLRHRCGLFVSIYGGRVYLLHQTAREFLIDELSELELARQPPWRWRGSMDMTSANRTIAEICITYLLFTDFTKECFAELDKRLSNNSLHFEEQEQELNFLVANRFLFYSACNWIRHFGRCDPRSRAFLASSAVELFSQDLRQIRHWFRIYGHENGVRQPSPSSHGLILASYFGLHEVVELLLFDSDPNIQRGSNRFTALQWATMGDYTTTVKILLDKGADPNIGDIEGKTPLFRAVENCNVELVRLLLDRGANINAIDEERWTTLHYAVIIDKKEAKTIVEMLLKAGADANRKIGNGYTPLELTDRWKLTQSRKLLEGAISQRLVTKNA